LLVWIPGCSRIDHRRLSRRGSFWRHPTIRLSNFRGHRSYPWPFDGYAPCSRGLSCSRSCFVTF
jgi:hypothetical protein